MGALGKRRREPDGLDTMRKEFLQTASDRLKTPVTSLGLALQRMEDVQSEEERKKFIEMAKRGQRELEQAVEDVLDTARNEQRRSWR